MADLQLNAPSVGNNATGASGASEGASNTPAAGGSPWSAAASLIIKASDNINRGVENASEAGEGSNGQSYQSKFSDSLKDMKDTAQDIIEESSKYSDDDEEDYSNNTSQSTAMPQETTTEAPAEVADNVDVKNKTPGMETSDERLKRVFAGHEDAIDCFAKIDSIMFNYNEKAKQVHPDGENNVDSDTHYGVKAQDLEKNPYTKDTVSKDDSGFLQVNTDELTMANSAVISEICRRIKIIEKVLGIEVK